MDPRTRADLLGVEVDRKVWNLAALQVMVNHGHLATFALEGERVDAAAK
jgi:hypothetical protein